MTKTDMARDVRTIGLALLTKSGEWNVAGARVLMATKGDLSVAYRTPFTRVPTGAKSYPYGMDVWFRRKKVANKEWDYAEGFNVISLHAGNWLQDLRSC